MDDPEDSKPHALPPPTIVKGEADEEKQNRDGEKSNNRENNHANAPMTMDETLQSFLSSPSVGVLAHKDDVMIESDPTADEDLIFESAFDLTEERLQYVYNMFDKNEKGNISYENLRHGLEVNCNSASPSGTRLSTSSRTTSENEYANSSSVTSFLDDASFNQLVGYLDKDQSGDITYKEFAAGIRLLMLRKMVLDYHHPMHPPSSCSSSLPNNNNNNGDNVRIQVMDYNASRLETYIINNNDNTTTTTTTSDRDHPGTKTSSDCNRFPSSIASAREMKVTDFYFQDRPSWVKTRWIDVSVCDGGGASASASGVGSNGTAPSHAGGTILKQLAIKYLLHPLALEDALSFERNRRPKADVYSSHYFIMVPIFIVEPLLQSPAKKLTERTTTSFLSWMYRILFCRQGTMINDKGEAIENDKTEEEKQETTTTKVGKIHVRTTSIFVTIPSNDTIITYNSGCWSGGGGGCGGDNHSINVNNNNNFWLRVQKELGKSYSKLRQYDAQYLTYALLDQAVDQIEPIIETVRKEIIHERHILKSNNYYHNTSLDRIHNLRKELEMIVRKLKPFMRLLDHVIEDDTISAGATIYLRDVLDNLECYDEETKDLITLCQSVDVEIDDFQSHKMDQTLFILTIISAIFLPAQFLTGVWGMNFHHMPELDETWGYGMFWCLSIFFSGSFLIFITRIHYYGKF